VPRALPALLLAALLAFDTAGAADWPPLTFTPPDIERTEPALARLRDRMLAAIRERRLADVRAMMAPTIRDQDVDTPVADVLESFGPLEPGTPPGEEWLALEQALRLGGIRRGNLYVVPYIERSAAEWKARHERLFVAGRDVPIRGDADPAAPIVTHLSYGLVQEAVGVPTRPGQAGAGCGGWTPIVDPAHMLAWVCTADVRPVSGLYYGFTRIGRAWKLTRIYSLAE
jgi:hypothetical protein